MAYDITALGTALEFDTTNAGHLSASRLPGTDKVAVLWYQSSTAILVQIFSLNRTTGAISAIGSPLDVESGTAGSPTGVSLVVVDASNLIVCWTGPSEDGFCQLISVDGTGNCTTNGAAFEFDAADGGNIAAVLWDSTHVLICWTSTSADGFAQVFTFSTGAGTIVAVSTPFEFDATDATFNNVIKLDSTHALVSYRGVAFDGFMVVLQVAAVTYIVTAAGTAFEFKDAITLNGVSAVLLSSGSPMVVALWWFEGIGSLVRIATFNISTSTWAITAFGTPTALPAATTSLGHRGSRVWAIINADTLFLATIGAGDDGVAYTVDYDSGSGALTTLQSYTFEADVDEYNNVVSMDDGDGLYVIAWAGTGVDGFIQAFDITLTASNIKSLDTNLTANIKSYNTNLIANVKSINTNV